MEYSKKIYKNGITLHTIKINAPSIKKKVFYQITDSHLALYNAESSLEDKNYAKKTAEQWLKAREYMAKSHNEVYNDMSKTAFYYFKNGLKKVKNADALFLTGDICDYVSKANLSAVEKELKNIDCKIMAVCGNHENPNDIDSNSVLALAKSQISVLELEDLYIIGINNSKGEISKEQNQKLLEILSLNKPVILIMHKPIKTKENAKLLESEGEYFYLNNSTCNKEVLEFVEILKQNDKKIIAVIAGHLHYTNITNITKNLYQIVAAQGILGNVFKYEIGK